ncbi:RagB/SusD family nutrient uptake outer membrane protein [Abyssalbus ytuae]|uniref:RagB/SusD family nutrient uptake outer membrane protein n=1 Tax=Abyssalbus ytuae TaxID=2926907 RepID=A0A9E7CTR8_9FLAO|nr:RagB/SusD family nutrient uptake outer membrane protein [Abyssalbus ytuae]UOB16677.1 RagB/SusD family nutrient uptake outer membrane protein [Abyssalbus ytuae]
MKLIYKIHFKVVLLSLSILAVVSCSDEFLEVIPKGKLVAEKTVDYHKMLYNLDLINMMQTNAQVPLSEELLGMELYFSNAALRTQKLYRWEADIYDAEENAQELELTMENLYIFNKIINEVMDATEGTEQQKLSIQAEARVGRAWNYFLLINYYGLPYNEATSSTDPGFPLIEKADLVASDFQRATVKEIYDFIEEDLLAAIPYLPTAVESRLRMSVVAGKALLGKVYVFRHEFEKARPLLEEAIAGMNNMGVEVGLYDYNVGYSAQLTVNDIENIYAKQFINNWANSVGEFVIKPEVADMYGENDLRLNQYSSTARDGSPYPVEGVLRRVRGTGQTQFGVLVPDLYLLNAEVKCRLNDLQGAVEDLEYFRQHRMPEEDKEVPAAIASDQVELLNFIFEERLREFAVLGERWWDIRRLTVDPLIPAPVSSYTHTVYNADGTVQGEYQLTRERLVLKFPQTVMDQNPNLQNNE